jgi:tetratricopeptide (TPR) repeat protein
MKAFVPTHSLTKVDVRQAQLIGYRRLTRRPPGVLLPVFKPKTKELDILVYQKIGDGGCVSSFVGDPDLQLDNLIPISATPEDAPVLAVGEPVIHAYETDNGAIIAEQSDQFMNLLKLLLQRDKWKQRPFAALEIARFVKDQDSEIIYAERCAHKLVDCSHNLASSWLRGTNLSSPARQAANLIVNSAQIAAEQRRVRGKKPIHSSESKRPTAQFKDSKVVPAEQEIEQAASMSLDELKEELRFLQRSGDTSRSIQLYREILALDPNDRHIWLQFAHILRRVGKLNEASVVYSELVNRFPDHLTSQRESAIALFKMEYFKEASQIYERMVGQWPQDWQMRKMYAESLKKLKKRDEAYRVYLEIAHIFSEKPEALIGVGTGLQELGKSEEAISILNETVRRFSEHNDIIPAF